MSQNNSKLLLAILVSALFIFTGLYLRTRLNNQNLALHPKGVVSNPSPAFTPTILREKAYVNFVFDGDTIELSGKITLRLLGIDAPETANKYTLFKKECFATVSAKIAKEIMMGQTVETEKDVEDKDQYGRLLRYVFLDDVFINEFLVRQGYAKMEPNTINTRYKNVLIDAEDEAKREKRGLWRECTT